MAGPLWVSKTNLIPQELSMKPYNSSYTAEQLSLLDVYKTRDCCTYNNEIQLTHSFNLEKRARQTIAGLTQSMMKKPEQFSYGQFPIYLEQGHGALVKDVDEHVFIDYICGLGANALGHNHPAINTAIVDALASGVLHSLPTSIEIETTENLLSIVPNVNMARFFKTGADANSAAIRLARYITGKDKIFTVGYNGWHDQYQYDTPGVPCALAEYTERLPLFSTQNETTVISKIRKQADSCAAILLSTPYNRQLSSEFIQELRHVCTQHKVLFIIDEVVTGFRLAKGGMQEYYQVKADMVTFSKSLAAGMPLSAIAGDKSLLSHIDKLQVSTTFGGERLSLAAANTALSLYRDSNIIEEISRLGRQFKLSVNEISESLGSPLRILGYDAIPMLNFDPSPEAHISFAKPFIGEMAKRGVLLRRDVNFISAAHTEEHIEYTVEQVADSLRVMLQNGFWR